MIFSSSRLNLSKGVYALACVGWWCAWSAVASTPSILDEARKALAEDVPQVAIFKIGKVLTRTDIPEADRHAATTLLAEAQLAAGSYEEALDTLQALVEQPDIQDRLLTGRAYAGLGMWDKALEIYEQLADEKDAPLETYLGKSEALQALRQGEAAAAVLQMTVSLGKATTVVRLRLAGMLVELGRSDEARKELAEAKPETAVDVQWKEYVEGRVLLSEKKHAEALVKFEQVLKAPEQLSENLLVAATLGATEASLVAQGPDVAKNALESFIWKHPECSYLELVFRRLDQVNALDKNPSEGELHRLVRQPPVRRAALAQFYVTRLQIREKRYERASLSAQYFLEKFPTHPLVPLVYQIQADVALLMRNYGAAEKALLSAVRTSTGDDQRAIHAEMELRLALIYFQQKEHLLAEKFFKSAAEAFPAFKKSAAFNGALAWLQQGNQERFEEALKAFREEFSDEKLQGNLMLEKGLVLARARDQKADEVFQGYLQEFQGHSRRGEASVALAELAFLEGDSVKATALVKTAVAAPASDEMSAQADYLSLFIEDAKQPRDDAHVIELARAFINKHPGSPQLIEVRMKLGQVYFQREDYANAQVQFETVAREDDKGLWLETSLFLAGQSAMKLMSTEGLGRAVELFEDVAKLEGKLKLHARLQEAIIYNKLGKDDDAVKLYDQIIAAQPAAEAEVKFAAYCGRGDCLVLLGKKDPQFMEQAIASYDQLASLADATPMWRNQALYKKAKVLEQLGRQDEAQATLYDVLERNATGLLETFWYYKSGFEAARVYEAQKQWKSAIGIYEKMVRLPGSRAEEARKRLKDLRLEHFIWD